MLLCPNKLSIERYKAKLGQYICVESSIILL